MTNKEKKKIAEWVGGNFEENWNPDTDATCWPEIYDKLLKHPDNLATMYINAVGNFLKLNSTQVKPWSFFEAWKFHTTPLEIRCKALLEVI